MNTVHWRVIIWNKQPLQYDYSGAGKCSIILGGLLIAEWKQNPKRVKENAWNSVMKFLEKDGECDGRIV
jgi:hypothetical protein